MSRVLWWWLSCGNLVCLVNFVGEMRRRINCDSNLAANLLLLLLFASTTLKASSEEDGYYQCEHSVKKWASSILESEVNNNNLVLQDMLYFLHVPRTGGRTYYHCFLRKLFPNSLECPRSYDKLRFNPRKGNCRILITHDDYTIMSKLDKEKTSVVTILRDPVDRVFSAYEFSVEVAARFLVHNNLTSALMMSKSARVRSKNKGVSTLDIWPWKYLVPWMREDLFARRDARKHKDQVSGEISDPYNMKDIVMPLHDYINDPIARDIIHNGATFQIAGLTNNSNQAISHEVRHCVQKYEPLGKYVLLVAKKRLDDMVYIGLTEKHKESAAIFADLLGDRVISQLLGSNSSIAEQNSLVQVSKYGSMYGSSNSTYQGSGTISNGSLEAKNENMTANKLIKGYESCILNLRKLQSQRRKKSFEQIRPANFTKEARRRIPDTLLRKIMMLNHLDVELYKYAEDIFAKQANHSVTITVRADNLENMLDDNLKNMVDRSYGTPPWKIFYVALLSALLIFFILLFVNARRRTSKIKL